MVASLFHPLNIFIAGLGGGFAIPLFYRLGKPWLHGAFIAALCGITLVAGVAFALPDFAIVETKSTGRASRIDRTLWRLGYRPQRISKCATGLAALHRELPRNRWTRVLAGPLASPLVLPETTAARKDPTCFAA